MLRSASDMVRRPEVRELGQQIAVRSYFVSGHLAIGEGRQEGIDGVVGECTPTRRERRRARGVVVQNLGQHCSCYALCLLGRISPGVLERVREGGEKTDVVRRFPREVCVSFCGVKTEHEEELQGPRSALYLDPLAARTVRCNQRAVPQADLFPSQSRVWQLQYDTAYIQISEEIVPSTPKSPRRCS